MAEKIKNTEQTSREIKDIIGILGISPEMVKVKDLNQCKTRDEVEFELYSDYILAGNKEHEAKSKAEVEADEIWTLITEGRESF